MMGWAGAASEQGVMQLSPFFQHLGDVVGLGLHFVQGDGVEILQAQRLFAVHVMGRAIVDMRGRQAGKLAELFGQIVFPGPPDRTPFQKDGIWKTA